MIITNILKAEQQKQILAEIKTIFFESSSIKKFKDEKAKEAFFERWCGFFLQNAPQLFFIAMNEEGVLGYLSGYYEGLEPESKEPGRELFLENIKKYPAYFHINCHPKSRGQGVGGKLVDHFINHLLNLSIGAVHIITSPDAANVNFYLKMGFKKIETKIFKEHPLLLMGKTLQQ